MCKHLEILEFAGRIIKRDGNPAILKKIYSGITYRTFKISQFILINNNVDFKVTLIERLPIKRD